MKLWQIVFSPTGGTQKAADLLCGGLRGEPVSVDLCSSGMDFSAFRPDCGDTAVIAVPSYGGRVPAAAAQRLLKMPGGRARAVLLCVYGNRAYEDTLVELEDLAKAAGFRVAAAVAAVAEHSIARRYAAGRPDAKDAETLHGFARQIQAKLDAGGDDLPPLPGRRPYKPLGVRRMIPQAGSRCTACGLRAARCRPSTPTPRPAPTRTAASAACAAWRYARSRPGPLTRKHWPGWKPFCRPPAPPARTASCICDRALRRENPGKNRPPALEK